MVLVKSVISKLLCSSDSILLRVKISFENSSGPGHGFPISIPVNFHLLNLCNARLCSVQCKVRRKFDAQIVLFYLGYPSWIV